MKGKWRTRRRREKMGIGITEGKWNMRRRKENGKQEKENMGKKEKII